MTHKKARRSWWSWKKHHKHQNEKAPNSAEEECSENGNDVKEDSVMDDGVECDSVNAKTAKEHRRSFSLFRRGCQLDDATPDFVTLPCSIANSLLISLENRENTRGLTVNNSVTGIKMFKDDNILYYPFDKNTTDTILQEKNYHNEYFEQLKHSMKRKKDAVAHAPASEHIVSLKNLHLQDTIRYNVNTAKSDENQEPCQLWNVWVETKSNNRCYAKVKKKIFDRMSILELSEDYDYMLEFYAHDKSQDIHICPFGQRPLIGKSNQLEKYAVTFWIPMEIARLSWLGICQLILFDLLPFKAKTNCCSWKHVQNGYGLTIYLQESLNSKQLLFFLNELTLLMMKVCQSPAKNYLLEATFSNTRINGSKNSIEDLNK